MFKYTKASQGNRSLGYDFFSPSSRTVSDIEGAGWQYDACIADIHHILNNNLMLVGDALGIGMTQLQEIKQ